MTYSIPISVAMRAALSDSTKRYLKVTITHDGPIVFYPTKISGNVSEEYQSWNIQLKNYGEYTEGLFAGDLATVSFSHDGAEWITIMTGYVSPEGMNREQGFVSDDIVSFDLVDRTKGKGTKRKPSSTVFAALKICDPSDTSNSILHRLGSLMGITSFEVGLIQDVKDIIVLGEQVVWSELKLLRDAYKASMYFDYLGRLRFHSPLEIGWTDPESEWTFVADPSHSLDSSSSRVIGKVRRTFNQVSCNRAASDLNLFEQRTSRVIYRDTTNWNSDLSQCSIVIQPGATYPESGVLSLNYKDPSTGEEYPYATSVQVPSIGQSKNYDICYAGGRLSLVSFNGSDSKTSQQPGASQIILKNTGSLSCEIIKFEIRGVPFIQLSENKVEEVDSSVTDEVDYVDLSVDGKYATSVEQIDKVLSRHVEEGKIRTRHFSFATIFLPQIQREMACTYIDTDGSEIPCKVITYSHKSSGRTLDSMRTYVELDELLSYEPAYNPIVKTTHPASPVPIPGTPGDKVVTQFTLGDESGPFPTGWTIGQDGWEIGQDDWVIGQDDWVYEPPIPGEGQYIYKRVGTYNPATESWPSSWKVTRDTGLKGDPARSITLYADSNTIRLSSRGALKTSEIEITCVVNNLPIEDAVWEASDEGSLSPVETAPEEFDPYKRSLDCSLVVGESTLITVSITYGEQTYVACIGITKVRDGLPAPGKLPMATTQTPTETADGEPLVRGDFFLVGQEFSENGVTYKVGSLWEYTGSTWTPSEDAMKALDAMDDYVSVADGAEDGVFCQVIAKRIIAQKAVIEEIGTKEITLKTGGKIQSEVYTPGVAGFQIKADGSVDLINASMVSGLFTGAIDSPPLTTTNEGTLGNTITFNPVTHWYVNDAMSVLASQLTPNIWHNVSGSHDSVAITKLAVVTTANATITVASNSVSSTARPVSFTITVPYTATFRLRHKSRYYWDDWEYYPETVTLYRNGVVIYQSSPTYHLAYIDIALNEGDVITYYGTTSKYISTDEDYEVASLTLQQIFSTTGLYFLKNNTLQNVSQGYYESARLQIASPSFDSDSSTYKKYAKSTAFLAGVSSYSNNVFKTAQGTVIINGTSRTVNGVMKTNTGMTVFHNAGSQALVPVSSDPGSSGYYNMSGSYQVQTTVEGAATMNLNAKTADTYSIGTTVRYLNMAAKTMIAESYDNSSSRTLKKDITPFSGSALEILNLVDVVNYRYKSENGTHLHTGFIAEETPNPLTGENHNSMSLGDNIGMLIRAIQELYQLYLGGSHA